MLEVKENKKSLEQYLEFAKEIAKEAGKIMLQYFNIDNGATYKGDKTIVTLADKKINTYLINRVREKYPTHCVDGEEEKFGESNYVWVCDPIDGTSMYAKHIPVAVFSLALVINGISVVGVVYDPFTDNLYSAIKGQGAYKNGEKILVNNYNFGDMKMVTHFDIMKRTNYNVCDVIKKIGNKTDFVSIGSIVRASMCVATGDFSLAIFPGMKRKNCDIAATKVIVEEAGGKVTNFFGEEQRYDKDINGAIISNGIVHDEVVNLIRNYNKKEFLIEDI